MSNEMKDKRAPHLLARDFKEAQYKLPTWYAELPVGTPVEALNDPGYWANVAGMLNVPGIIYAMPKDGAYFAEFMIRSKGPNWAHVELLRVKQFISAETVAAQAAKTYKIEWGGPAHKHRVVRLADRQVVEKGFDTPEQAQEWVAANSKAVST